MCMMRMEAGMTCSGGWLTTRRNHGALHVKCAFVDDEAALLPGANLTEHAINLNMEFGLLVRGGEIPHSLAGRLWSLIHSRVLIEVSISSS